MAIWTPEMRARQSAIALKMWQARVRADPNSSALARARAFRDLSQRDLSALSGVSDKTISECEHGATLSPRTREKLARVLALPELF
jgi:DNA-binding XRE family transcriptional regulator